MAGHLACSQVEAKIEGVPRRQREGAGRGASRPPTVRKTRESIPRVDAVRRGQRRARNLKPHSRAPREGRGVKSPVPPPTGVGTEGCKTDPEPDMDTGRAGVRNMRSKCRCSYVLQFTFRRAVCCVLHRPPSQVIHCAVLSLHDKKPLSPRGRASQQPRQLTHVFSFHGEERGLREKPRRARRRALSGRTPHLEFSRRGPSRAKSRGNLTAPTRSRDVGGRRQASRGPERREESRSPPPGAEMGCIWTRRRSRAQIANDPTAGSPTVTLLRLLLPLNAQVWESSRAALEA